MAKPNRLNLMVKSNEVKAWLGYQNTLFPFISSGSPHLKHVVII
jgi:hypothetical protein